MAPRSRLLDLERDDVLSFNGAYDRSDDVGATAHALVFWHIFLVVAALLFLHLVAPFPHAAAVCTGLYVVAYCFLLYRAVRPSSAGCTIGQNSWVSRICAGAIFRNDQVY